MNNLSPTKKLSNLIAILEVKQRIEYEELKGQFEITMDTIKPSSVLTSAIAAFTSPAESKSGIVNSLLGLASGFITSKLINSKSNTIFKKFAGFGIQYITNRFLSKK